MSNQKCELCGEPMPEGETMFKYHGYSGPCPKPQLNKNDRGLYEKFTVVRNDGKSAKGEKHENCSYFVLDLTHDKHAIPALRAYAESCKEDFPKLSGDLIEAANIIETTS